MLRAPVPKLTRAAWLTYKISQQRSWRKVYKCMLGKNTAEYKKTKQGASELTGKK